MILDTGTLDCALEWLLPKIGTRGEKIYNDQNGEDVDAVAALCVWCTRLRYNLVEHDINGIDSKDYPAWHGYRGIISSNLYATIKKISKMYRISGGVTPDYSGRHHKDISKWSYKRIFGPDVFMPIHFDIEELWGQVQHMFPDITLTAAAEKREYKVTDTDRIDTAFLEFEINNVLLAKLISEM